MWRLSLSAQFSPPFHCRHPKDIETTKRPKNTENTQENSAKNANKTRRRLTNQSKFAAHYTSAMFFSFLFRHVLAVLFLMRIVKFGKKCTHHSVAFRKQAESVSLVCETLVLSAAPRQAPFFKLLSRHRSVTQYTENSINMQTYPTKAD